MRVGSSPPALGGRMSIKWNKFAEVPQITVKLVGLKHWEVRASWLFGSGIRCSSARSVILGRPSGLRYPSRLSAHIGAASAVLQVMLAAPIAQENRFVFTIFFFLKKSSSNCHKKKKKKGRNNKILFWDLAFQCYGWHPVYEVCCFLLESGAPISCFSWGRSALVKLFFTVIMMKTRVLFRTPELPGFALNIRCI